ncbi:MAG TPA: ABC transporter permease, partial [Candidatus Methylomirabilis sp.]|nr:ABC transporter permease [Candidatus Methylomirabilis sp.]
MDKRRYLTKKILNAVLTIVLVACFNFMLFRILPGNPARLLLPKGHFTPQSLEQEKRAFHLDRPLWEQFGYYWVDTLKGDFGNSYAQKESVVKVVGRAIWPTLVLVGVGTLFATIIGVSLGVIAGWRRNGKFDVTATNLGMVLYSMPTFWVAMLFILFFSVKLGWFPSGRMMEIGATYSGFVSKAQAFLYHLFLPALVFAITYAAEYQLIMRSSITSVMKEDFVLTARAKGISDRRVLWGHVTPNAMLPSITLVMMNFGFVLSGAILVETVFNWPGLGLLSYTSMLQRDYPVMQAVFLLASVA